ncbi:hypothetical protein A4X13_0g2155 [Tilletia indica]|uniref:Uncharacterized protein n=1 Tax=Tilletia indica TaxID=43049 RepID=A0A177TNY8_9BASI|nr:hypothetical protein A4X13_0g2155 [Tilletia indica]
MLGFRRTTKTSASSSPSSSVLPMLRALPPKMSNSSSSRKRQRRCLGLLSSRTATLILAVFALVVHWRAFLSLGQISVSLHQHHLQHHNHLRPASSSSSSSSYPSSATSSLQEVLWELEYAHGGLPKSGSTADSLFPSLEVISSSTGKDTDPYLPTSPSSSSETSRGSRLSSSPSRSAWRTLSFNIVPVHSRLTSPDITTADISERRRWNAIWWLVKVARLYFAVGVLCAAAGIVGVLRSDLRLTRLFLAHSSLDLLLTTLFFAALLLLFTSPTLRAAICEGFASGAKMQDWWFANAHAGAGAGAGAGASTLVGGTGGAAEAVAAATATAVAAATRYQQQHLKQIELQRQQVQKLAQSYAVGDSAISLQQKVALDAASSEADASSGIMPTPPSVDALVEQTLVFFGPDSNCDEALIQLALPVCLCIILLYTGLRVHFLLCVNRYVAKLWRKDCIKRGGLYMGMGSLLPLVRGSSKKSTSSAANSAGVLRWLRWRSRSRSGAFEDDEKSAAMDEEEANVFGGGQGSSDSDAETTRTTTTSSTSRTLVPTSSGSSSSGPEPCPNTSSTSSTPRSTTPLSSADSDHSSASTLLNVYESVPRSTMTMTLDLLRAAAAAFVTSSPFSLSGGASRQGSTHHHHQYHRHHHHHHHRMMADLEEAQPMLGGLDVVTIRRPPLGPSVSIETKRD